MKQLAEVLHACAVEQFPGKSASMSLSCAGSMTFGGGNSLLLSKNYADGQHTNSGDVAGQSSFIFWMHHGDDLACMHACQSHKCCIGVTFAWEMLIVQDIGQAAMSIGIAVMSIVIAVRRARALGRGAVHDAWPGLGVPGFAWRCYLLCS